MYAIAHFLAPFLVRKYHFHTDVMKKTDYNYFVMSNHLTESDMMVMMAAFPKHMYFVCGEHLTRNKNARLIWKFFDPIPEFKGSNALPTVKEIIKRVKDGHNIMIFPEGSRSFHGETEPVTIAAGKMVKLAGCGLVTYRIHGGYFIAPRWAYHFRKGKMDGEIVGVYSPEQLKAMTPQEITDIINRDIHENATETQRKRMDNYIGKGLAEGLENYLLICPECGAYDSMESKDDTFRCKCCGKGGTYTKKGFLEGDGLKFDNVYDWGKWIERRFVEDMTKRFEENEEDANSLASLFNDPETKLYEITPDHRMVTLDQGTLKGYRNRMVYGEREFCFSKISEVSMLYYGKTLLFDYNKKHYGITGEHFHAWKYNALFDLFKKK